MRGVSLIAIVFLMLGCSLKTAPQKIVHISQDPSLYTSQIQAKNLATMQEYRENYFKPWSLETIDITPQEAMWADRAYSSKNSYGANLQALEENFFRDTLKNANYEEFSTINKFALSLELLDIRAMPTDKPLFMNPSRAGEGYPFDYLQNSTIAANKPLFVSHYSKDKEWAFVRSSFAYGWVKKATIATLKKSYTKFYSKAEQVFLLSDNTPLYDSQGNFLFRSRVGMMLPLIAEDSEEYTLLAVTSDREMKPLYKHIKLSKKIAHRGPLEFNAESVALILGELQHSIYGWGGMNAERDCSSTLRDFYAPFALWLPRNSSKQAEVGERSSLVGLSAKEKIEYIKREAIPFETLLYKSGHIVLYTGVVDEKITIFQNIWGVKTKKDTLEGRFIIGKPIFSRLDLGSELIEYDKSSSFIENLKSLNRVSPQGALEY